MLDYSGEYPVKTADLAVNSDKPDFRETDMLITFETDSVVIIGGFVLLTLVTFGLEFRMFCTVSHHILISSVTVPGGILEGSRIGIIEPFEFGLCLQTGDERTKAACSAVFRIRNTCPVKSIH